VEDRMRKLERSLRCRCVLRGTVTREQADVVEV